MGRMYHDKTLHTHGWRVRCVVIAAVLLVLAAFLVFKASMLTASNMSAQSEQAIAQSVTDSAIQCFSVEGSYPSSLTYLEDNYGLRVNHSDYYVTYETFGSNVMPDIRVLKKH